MEHQKELFYKIEEEKFVERPFYDKDFGMPPKFLTDLGFGEATDLWGEEIILRKCPNKQDGEYENETFMRDLIEIYRLKKLTPKA